MSFVTYSQRQIDCCYTDGLLYAERGIAVPRNLFARCAEGTCEAIWFVLFIFVGAVCNLQTYELCGTVMPHLR